MTRSPNELLWTAKKALLVVFKPFFVKIWVLHSRSLVLIAVETINLDHLSWAWFDYNTSLQGEARQCQQAGQRWGVPSWSPSPASPCWSSTACPPKTEVLCFTSKLSRVRTAFSNIILIYTCAIKRSNTMSRYLKLTWRSKEDLTSCKSLPFWKIWHAHTRVCREASEGGFAKAANFCKQIGELLYSELCFFQNNNRMLVHQPKADLCSYDEGCLLQTRGFGC